MSVCHRCNTGQFENELGQSIQLPHICAYSSVSRKVKGYIRKATECIHKGEVVDDMGALIPLHPYLDSKMFEAIENLPPNNQQSLVRH